MVDRSAPFPMQIDIAIDPPLFRKLKSLAASLPASRIRTLRLSGHPPDVLRVLKGVSNLSALESLNLWVTRWQVPHNLAEALCERDVPHLRRLTFESSARIGAPLWLLAGITHFTTNTGVSPDELLATLQAMPQLEELCIVNTRVATKWDELDLPKHVPRERAMLPRLSLLFFRDRIPNHFVTLSSCIDGPPTLRRRFFLEVPNVPVWFKWDSLLMEMQTFVSGDSAQDANDGGLRVAQMRGYECGWFEVWSRTYSESASTATRDDALFLLHVEWFIYDNCEPSLPNPFFFFASTCFHLLNAYIEDLTIMPGAVISGVRAADPLIITEKWQELLAELPSVKVLRLRNSDTACTSVLEALSTSAQPLLPYLHRLIVVNSAVHFTPAALPDDVGVAGAGAGCSAESRKFVQANVGVELVEAVSGRSGLEIVLAGCEVDYKALDALRRRARVYIGYERVYM